MSLFSTDVMMRVVDQMFPAPQYLLQRFFPTIQIEQAEEIHFDLFETMRRVAPFVHHLVEGQIVESPGYSTTTFAPPYIKDKRVFDTTKPFRRSAGEQIGGSLTPGSRMAAQLAFDLQDQINMVELREEVMAAEALQTGQLTIVGDKYKKTVLDFRRDPTLVFNAAVAWDQAGAKPLADLEKASFLMLQKTGAAGTEVIMGTTAWQWFRANEQVTAWLDMNRAIGAPPTMSNVGANVEGGTFMGTVDRFNITVYAGWWVDPMSGQTKEIWDSKAVVVTSGKLDGVRCYGAIRDHRAIGGDLPDNVLRADGGELKLRQVRYFVKSWMQEDPSVRYLMLQSAPLPVPTRINASAVVKTLIA